ncbi:hypothetical protein WDZ11_22385 (plasmid) [Roseomonas mucosa]|uniref:secretion/conjugation apparatus DotM-related subunit n=1 Tax=Roseomonas mucosa TaxID=207340 RepID=UPI0030D5E7A2
MSAGQGGGRSGWASSDDYTFLSLAVIVIGLAFGGWMLWSYHHKEVVETVATLQLLKMSLFSGLTDRFEGLAKLVRGARYETVTFDELLALCARVNGFIRLPAVALLCGLGVLCFFAAPSTRFRRRLDLDGLTREQARFHRAASAHAGRGLRLVPLPEGPPRPADPALHTHEWLVRLPVEPPVAAAVAAAGGRRRQPPPRADAEEVRIRKALVAQLGPLWRGAAGARPQARIMFAAFGLHLAGRREESLVLLGDLAEALAADAGHGTAGPEAPLAVPPVVLASADRVIADGTVSAGAEAAALRHAYETTALMGLLNAARLDAGVLPPAQFNGLKLLDRGLWYALHSLGFPGHGPGQNAHPNPRVEAIGARAHWDAERQARCALFEPEIEFALHAVRAAIEQHDAEQREQP